MKRMREERALSQTKLAALADVNPATINQVELGRRYASEKTLRKLAHVFGVGLAELLGEKS
jgi:transcriptional regulator with XRE-family HTH domain